MKVREFAKQAGVSVKALYLYERHGLLRPPRTSARYRTYRHADLRIVREIRALRFLGFSLRQIKAIRCAGAAGILEAIRDQRRAMERKQALLTRGIAVLNQAESAISGGLNCPPLTVLAGRAGWELGEFERESRGVPPLRAPDRVSPAKRALFDRFAALLADDPESPRVQAAVSQWNAMLAAEVGEDPELRAAIRRSWQRRALWPDGVKNWVASLYGTDVETWSRVADLIDHANPQSLEPITP